MNPDSLRVMLFSAVLSGIFFQKNHIVAINSELCFGPIKLSMIIKRDHGTLLEFNLW